MALYARVAQPWFLLGWIGLVPWLAALDRTTSLRGALGAGLLMSVAFVLAVFGWFADAIAAYSGAPAALAWTLLALAAPVLQPQLITFALARHVLGRVGAGTARTALGGAGVWVGTEWALPKLFGDTIGHGFLASPLLRQAADLGGAPGLTFALLVANECVLAAVRAARPRAALRPLGVLAALVAALGVYGAVRLRQLAPPRGVPLAAGVVQADIAAYDRLAAERGRFETVRAVLDAHFALSDEALGRGVDLLVWPETVYPTTFGTPRSADGAAFDRAIAGFVSRARVPLVFGAYDTEGGREFNAAVVLTPAGDGRVDFDAYRKAALFPLTERVPGRLEFLRGWLPWLGAWTPGGGGEVVTIRLRDGRTVRLAPLICYDAVDPRLAVAAVRRGAELIVTLSNDSWFATGLGPRLHLVVSAFRSLETRRPQVRATSTGVSAVIDPTGAILATADVHQRGVLVARVTPVADTTTLVLAWGDWLGPPALGVGLALLLLPARPRRLVPNPGRGPCW